jgi:hypothetical protein
MEWLSEDENGKYITTQEGLKNNLDNLRFWKLNTKIRINPYIKICQSSKNKVIDL